MTFVYGYRGFDTRNNVKCVASSNRIVYHTAAIGVVYNKDNNSQIYNQGHTDDIICLAVHPEGHLVVSGEIGKRPKIVLWDANSGSTLCTIAGFHTRGVGHVAFNKSADLIASQGLDDDHSIAIYSLQGKLVASSKASKQNVCTIHNKNEDFR